MKHLVDLSNKVALITGGSDGIGFGIAREFVDLGARVVITGRSPEKLTWAKQELGENCFVFVNDVTIKTQHEPLVEEIESTIGPIDILVNNAGRHCKKPSLETTDEEFHTVMDTNINSLFSLTRSVVKRMIPRGRGSVTNISSMSALYGLTQVAAYSSSKTALLGLTRTLASEYSGLGVRFNCIAPGFIESQMFLDIMAKDKAREKRILERTPAGRFGKPEDIAGAAAFLACDAASFITGICLPVDGGNSIGF